MTSSLAILKAILAHPHIPGSPRSETERPHRATDEFQLMVQAGIPL